MCLVIPILPLARLMKNLKAHIYFRGIKRFLPFSDPSEGGQGGRLRMTRHILYCFAILTCEFMSEGQKGGAAEGSQGVFSANVIQSFG